MTDSYDVINRVIDMVAPLADIEIESNRKISQGTNGKTSLQQYPGSF